MKGVQVCTFQVLPDLCFRRYSLFFALIIILYIYSIF